MNHPITIKATIHQPLEVVWKTWNTPEDICQWNHASPDWHCPESHLDLNIGGQFDHLMAAKDGSVSFHFIGTYTAIIPNQLLEITLEDDRKMKVEFMADSEMTHITESFEAENQNPRELQEMGWQAILNNFKQYCESSL